MNLAVQFGAKRLLLIGFDMRMDRKAHWHSDYRGLARPDARRIETWRQALDGCAPQFVALGVEVINCALSSALTAFPKMSLAEALA